MTASIGAWVLGIALLACGSAAPARAQDSIRVAFPPPAEDSTAVAPAPPANSPPPAAVAPLPPPPHAPAPAAAGRVTSTFRRTGEERDRFEAGAGVVRGFFDVNGTFAYRRFLSEGRTVERSIMGEVSGSSKAQLTEGVASFYLLLRPVATYRQSWRLRPLLEIGPAFHTVVQGAVLEGLNRTRYKAHVYLKTHGYAGFEVLATRKLGFLVRGRMSVPSHRPFDYAQAAIFLR
jgi:hypothetical protein